MNEESDGINENENNNSEVVILPERSHVDELLLSDQSEIREDPSDYERKLDEKLKDLGLLEDDMTINQKEELLAVVVISCETAEQEENKRQLIKEYLEGAQSLQDEIEFSLQESAWLADEANLLCLSTGATSKDDTSVKTKISSFMDCEPSTSSKEFEGFESLTQTEERGTSFKSSPVIFDYTTASSELFLQSSSTSENDSKKQVLEKGQSSGSRKLNHSISEANVKVAITHPILQSQITKRSKAEQLLDTQLSIQVENVFLDKTMSSWKPCMSPKDRPLSGFRYEKQKKENITPSAQDKINKYLISFGKYASSLKKKRTSSSRLIQLNKPYVVLHHGSLARKACKLDNYDFIIGVTDRVQPADTEKNFIPCNTLTRAKSAFHRVKPSVHGRLISFPDEDTPSKTTRSGAMYSSQKLFKEKIKTTSEIILDDCFNQTDNASDDVGVMKAMTSEKRVTFQDDVIKHDSSRKLPEFSDLKPEVHKLNSMIIPIIKKESSQSIKPNCSLYNNTEKISIKEEKLGHASEKDYSSDSSSSLIDVETIVDDEIEEFVMKRKLTSSTHRPNYAKSSCHSKKLKKTEP